MAVEVLPVTPNAARPGLHRTAASATVYLFLNYMGASLSYTPMAELFVGRSCAKVGLDEVNCHEYIDGVKNYKYDEAQRMAASQSITYSLTSGLASLSTCALFGVLGDAYGRRIPLFAPIIAGVTSNCVWALTPSFAVAMPLQVASSLLGGAYVANHAAFATLADVTLTATPRERSLMFGLVEGAIWTGLLVGPILGGIMVDMLGSQKAYFVPCGVGLLQGGIACSTYCETLDQRRRHQFSWSRANPFASLGLFFQTRTTLLMGGITLGGLTATNGGVTMLSLFVQKAVRINAAMLGALQSTILGSSLFGLLICMPMMVRCISLPNIMALSCLNGIACWVLMSFSNSTWQFYAIGGSLITTSCFFPVVRTGMTNTFGRSRYGESLAAVGVVEQITSMIGAPIVNAVYDRTEANTLRIGSFRVTCIACFAPVLLYVFALLCSISVREVPKEVDGSDESANCVADDLIGS